ncbi:hypothetical protein Bca4012_026591 [Brassica carinata]
MPFDLRGGNLSYNYGLLRSWEARNGKRGGELIWLDMLMVDVNATVMQAMISVNRLIRFRHKLTAGKMSSVTGFDFARCAQNIRPGILLHQAVARKVWSWFRAQRKKTSQRNTRSNQRNKHSMKVIPSLHGTQLFLIFVP